MFEYSVWQWLMLFYMYAFVGWCIESTFVSVQEKRFVNRGFLRSPFIPIYGFGAMVILFTGLPNSAHPVLVFLYGMVGASILEYVTGWLMEVIFKTKYWDYSDQKFNLQGRICLSTSLAWGGLSLVMIYLVHTPFDHVVRMMNDTLIVSLSSSLSTLVLIDFVVAVRTAVNVNRLMEKASRIRHELEEAKSQLESALLENERAQKLRARIEELQKESTRMYNRANIFMRDFVRAHPTAKNSRFNVAFKEVREKFKFRRKHDDQVDED